MRHRLDTQRELHGGAVVTYAIGGAPTHGVADEADVVGGERQERERARFEAEIREAANVELAQAGLDPMSVDDDESDALPLAEEEWGMTAESDRCEDLDFCPAYEALHAHASTVVAPLGISLGEDAAQEAQVRRQIATLQRARGRRFGVVISVVCNNPV